MKLWLISQTVNTGYDTYSDAVVAAESDAEARALHPDGDVKWMGDARWRYTDGTDRAPLYPESGWAHPASVVAKLIGEALPETTEGVICASFHAG